MNIDGPSFVPTHPNDVELERLGDEIAELAAHLDAATARLLDLIREFDARGGWGNGFASCAAWLTWRVGLDPGAARERVRVARALDLLPRLKDALTRGELSYSKVRALTRVATPETEERLIAVGRAGTAEHVERVVRGWRRVDRIAEAQEITKRRRRRTLQVFQDEDGMVVIHGRLEPEAGAVLMKALEAGREALTQRRRVVDVSAETRPDVSHCEGAVDDASDSIRTGLIISEDPPSWGQRQADALALIAETALHRGINPGVPGERYQVVVHIDAPALANSDAPGQSVLEDGTHVSAETSRRLACDATRVVMRHDADARITEVGARTRTIPPALRRALQHRDNGCRFPGCGLPFGQGHHIKHWAHGGPTKLSNLAMLCRRHHRAVHEEGFQVERQANGELCFRRPDGRPLLDVPSPPAVPANPSDTVRAQNDARGVHINAQTSTPGWQGERLDVGYAISVLHPRATGS